MAWFRKGSGQTKAKAPVTCPSLYDAGNYGGVRYWCENTSSKGPLGQGTRIPLIDASHLSNFCEGSYKRCPLNSLR